MRRNDRGRRVRLAVVAMCATLGDTLREIDADRDLDHLTKCLVG
jgi:hypothetical protein